MSGDSGSESKGRTRDENLRATLGPFRGLIPGHNRSKGELHMWILGLLPHKEDDWPTHTEESK
jgi:hypothetical protein